MDSNQKLEPVDRTIQRVLEAKQDIEASAFGSRNLQQDDDYLALNKLLSQLEAVRQGCTHKESKSSTEQKEKLGGVELEEIMKELKRVKWQNSVTQLLVSALIIITVVRQVSEVSLFLKVKDELSHPFRSFGSLLFSMMGLNKKDGEKEEQKEESPLHLPELPNILDLGFNNGEKKE